jgi:hypothetical protein
MNKLFVANIATSLVVHLQEELCQKFFSYEIERQHSKSCLYQNKKLCLTDLFGRIGLAMFA